MTSTSSHSGSSEHSSHCSQTKGETKNDAVYEIANHTWQFPSLGVARMLSPKSPKQGLEAAGDLLPLDRYDCMVDDPTFRSAVDDVVTQLGNDATFASRSFEHHDLAAFFTRCIEVCHDALDKQQGAPIRQDRWYKDLRFTVGNAPADYSRESASPEPATVGERRFSAGGDELLYRDPPGGKPTNRRTLLVETEGSWNQMVSKASDDARCLFGANRVRSFALVLAFNQDERALRFLIFHPGGLTASEPCSITAPGGLEEIARLFLVLASWSTPGDAGFVDCCTDTEYVLPADQLGENYVLAEVDEVLSCSPRVRGRMTLVSRLRLPRKFPMEDGRLSVFHNARHCEVNYVEPKEIICSESDPIQSEINGPVVVKTSWPEAARRGKEAAMYLASNGQFGTIPHVCSYETVDKHHQVISNILFLPRDDDIARCHWPIFSEDQPEKPDLRTLWFNVLSLEGQSLVEAESPRQLSRAWVHFVLGWLLTYLSGYLQRDVSIGNVLMTEQPVKGKVFRMPKEFLVHLSSLGDGPLVAEILVLCKRVEELVTELGISDEYIGFVADGDLAIPWKDCFSEEYRSNKSGTPEFMSRGLASAAKTGESYLHSPVDDLESCFWVAFWSVLFNKENQGLLSIREREARNSLANTNKSEAASSFHMHWPREGLSSIMQCFRPTLVAWWKKVMDKGKVWGDEVLDNAPEGAGEEYYLPHFHLFALQGVVDVLEVMSEHWNDETGWESWIGPVASVISHLEGGSER